MRIIEPIAKMRLWSEAERRQDRRIVLVPTMGFLHEGHLSLVRDAKERGDRTVVSIFVNPKQFGPREDFAGYPRDPMRDQTLLEKESVDVLFYPSAQEIYPDDFATLIEVAALSAPLCGAQRPGHFSGVATIVAKLFNIVCPHAAIFGCKDYQQLQIIRRLVTDLNFAIEVIGHPTVREPDGLALSSRNIYLTPAERKAALCLFAALRAAESLVGAAAVRRGPIIDAVRAVLESEPLAKTEYISLCDLETLRERDHIEKGALLALAVRIGRARLIDNVVLAHG